MKQEREKEKMKTRLDFVSNSSSTSFMLVGCVFTSDEVREAYLKTEHSKTEEAYDSTYDMAEHLACQANLQIERGVDNYYGWVVGLKYEDMKSDETRSVFEARVKSMIEAGFGVSNIQVKACLDGGYEG